MLKDCSKKPNAPWVDVPARLEAIIGNIRRYRANLYPEGWEYDPLYRIQCDLEQLLEDASSALPRRED